MKKYVERFSSFGSEKPTKNLLRGHKALQRWTAGFHGVGTWYGADSITAQKIMPQRIVSYDHEKKLVRRALNLKEEKKKA